MTDKKEATLWDVCSVIERLGYQLSKTNEELDCLNRTFQEASRQKDATIESLVEEVRLIRQQKDPNFIN